MKHPLSILLLMVCLLAFCSFSGPEGTYESAQKFEAQTGYMRMISAGYRHTVGLEADGTVVAVGDNDDGQCDVKSWTDIVAVATGTFHTVGLKADGTVVAVGQNKYDQCNVSDWKLW